MGWFIGKGEESVQRVMKVFGLLNNIFLSPENFRLVARSELG